MSALRDLKYLPLQRQQEEIRLRALWATVGAGAACLFMLAFGLVGAWDHEDELRIERAEAERLQAIKLVQAYNAGFDDATDATMCWGVRVDRRTGKAVP